MNGLIIIAVLSAIIVAGLIGVVIVTVHQSRPPQWTDEQINRLEETLRKEGEER